MRRALFRRAEELLESMDMKYLRILEDLVIEEQEILSRSSRGPEDELALAGIKAKKWIIAKELGVSSGPGDELVRKLLTAALAHEEEELEAEAQGSGLLEASVADEG
ncbi:MAG: hypothetical protein ABWK00_01735 [Desulfurococcaceae archaeon]